MGKKHYDISIVGSCVSRDVFEIDEKNKSDITFSIKSFWQGISPFSNYSNKIPVFQNILDEELTFGSPWQKRCVQINLRKNLIDKIDFDVDFLIIDAALFCQTLVYTKNYECAYLTKTATYDGNSLFLKNKLNEELENIQPWELKEEYIDKCLKQFVDDIFNNIAASKIIYLDIFNSMEYLKDNKLIKFSPTHNLNKKNEFLKIVNSRLKLLLGTQVNIINFPQEVYCDPNQKWGLFPLHFDSQYYKYLFQSIIAICIGEDKAEINQKLEKLYNQCESFYVEQRLLINGESLMIKTIENVAMHHCSGCSACLNICPTGAITMKSNSEGYLFPEIDKSKCINCGLCYKKCPTVNFDKFENDNPTVYAMMASDEIRKTSSSGGMFSCLAEYVFKKRGIVCGVSNKTPLKLEFSFAENMKELEKIKGSKYFQAEVGDTFQTIQNYLDSGRYVLFCACPCQVAGLKNFLGKDYSNLILADVVCHGVPSAEMVEKYASTIQDPNDIEELKFRDKEVYKWSTTITIKNKNQNIIRKNFNEASFYGAFGSGLAMRESCYNCKFAKVPRVGDFTLADYWHISEFNKDINDWYGTSCVLVNNKKAEQIYKEIEPKMKKSSLMPFETAIKYNTQLREPIKRNPNRDLFYKKIKTENFDDVLNYCLNRNHFDVGLIGYWYATNYGSVLTYYALYKAIEQMGYKTVILDRPDKHLDKEPQTVFARQFMNRFANVSDSYSHFEQGKYNNLCDKFVIGSDQVWTRHAIMGTGYRFFLDFVSDEKTKVAYAPSFGQDRFDALPETKRIVSYLLSRFDAISVRENTGIDICKKEFDIDAVQMIDPIFLQEREFYENIAHYSNKNETEPYILSYILDPDEDKRNMLLYSQEKKNMKLINLLDGRYNTFETNNKKLNLPNTPRDVNEEEWVKYFKNAEFVVTDSHHGFAMAVIFNKPVICIMNKSRGGTRFTSLLGWLGMMDRLIDKIDKLSEKNYLFDNYDYSNVNKVIAEKRQESLVWLKNSLSKEKNNPSSIYDFVNGRLKEMERKIAELKHQNQELKNHLENVNKRGN